MTSKENQNIKSAVKTENVIMGELFDGTKFKVNIPENDPDLLKIAAEHRAVSCGQP